MRHSVGFVTTLFCATLVSGCAAGAAGGPGGAATAAQPAAGATAADITPNDLRVRIGLLAHDSLQGRETGTPGAEAAALYLAAEMERLGLQPAGDPGSYLQQVPLQRSSTEATISATNSAGAPVTLTTDDILPVAGLGGLPLASRESGSGPLVFGGHIVDPGVVDDLEIADLREAIVIVRLSPPAGVDPTSAQPRLPMIALFGPTSPAAAVLLVAEETEVDFWEYATEIATKGAVALANTQANGPTAPPFFLISIETAERLLGSSLAEARQPRTGLGTFEYSLEERVDPIVGWNVAAVLPGKHSTRAAEYVGLGAHYDHVGVGEPVNGDSIYNGADDNASGTAGLLEVAERLAHLPVDQRPDRSVLFVWNAAEESGLLGSEFFTDRPTVARSAIIAHVNLDMIGRNSADSLGLVGTRRISTQLGDLVEEVNERQSRPFILDYTFDAPGHPEQIYCRSDHYNYARYGIPVAFLSTGLHDDYHAPSDSAEKIEYEKAARVTELVYDMTMALGNLPARPVVDQFVPPLGTPCQG